MIRDALLQLVSGKSLSQQQSFDVISTIMDGSNSDAEIASLLTAWATLGESSEELAGVAAALRSKMAPISTLHPKIIDTCGTGGDGSGTFNVSTAAAIVTAATGLPLAKHGNKSVTSKTGSADVLSELGVNIAADLSIVEACLNELGLCFCFAPLHHGSMKHVGPVRKQLPFPTIFNCVGPLANPAQAPFQVIGVGRPKYFEKIAEALSKLGVTKAAVVRGQDGLDEVTITGPTDVLLVENDGVSSATWNPSDFGLETSSLESTIVETPAESAAIIRSVLAGEKGAARDLVVANSAAALWIAGDAENLTEAAEKAAAAIDSSAAANLLEKLAERSNS